MKAADRGRPGRPRFSIRFLLVAMAAVAIGMAAYRAEHSWLGRMAIHDLTMFLATASILGVSQTTGKLKAFFIGMAFVLSVVAIDELDEVARLFRFRHLAYLATESEHWSFWCLALVNGLFAVFLHSFFVPRKDDP